MKRVATLGMIATLLTACGGGSHPSVLPSSPGVSQPQSAKTMVTLRVNVPVSPASATTSVRKPQYISPSTQSLVYVISQNGTPVSGGGGYVNLTTASSYCSSSGALQPLICSTQIPITLTTSGSYTFNVATYDQKQTANCTPGNGTTCVGNALSDQNVTETLTAGASNTVSLTLGANATAVNVTPIAPGYLRGDVHQLALWGAQQQNVAINALDADGNAIVGPGAPTIAVTSSSATLSATALNSETNVFTLEAATTGSPAVVTPGVVNLKVVLSASPAGGSVPSAAISVPVTIAHSVLYVSLGSAGNVYAYYDGNTNGSNPNLIIGGFTFAAGLAVDASGTLYVADSQAGKVTEYPFGSTTASTSITSNLSEPTALAVDAVGTLYVDNAISNSVTEYAAGSTSTSATISNADISNPEGVAVDSLGTLYVASNLLGVSTYAPGKSNPSAALYSGISYPLGIAVDANGTLYVANSRGGSGNGNVTEYTAPITSASSPSVTISNGVDAPSDVAVDAGGTLYVGNNGNDTITEYSAGNANSETTIALPRAPWYVAVVPASLQP